MRITTTIFLLFNLTMLQAQGPDNLWTEKQLIISEYEDLSKIDTSVQYNIADSSNRIFITIKGTDSLELIHYIKPYHNGTTDNESICDSMMIKLLCTDCVDKHTSKLIYSRDRKWLQISDTFYISQKWVSKFRPADKSPNIYTAPVMEIKTKEIYTEVILYTQKLTKKELKELKKIAVTNNS